ncbi:MAG: hypothetical protein Q4G46_04305 [Propionibacteriaceae bacterium]|nr:hypothetical protein [Propionibacteriaceae bacterium]
MNEPWWALARWGIVLAWTLLAVFGGDRVVRRVFHWAGELSPNGPTEIQSGPAADQGMGHEEDRAVAGPAEGAGEASVPGADGLSPIEAAGAHLRGGRAIGWLERLATVATLLGGFPAGIAAIVAVKGLARYPDLKAADGTAERFILGTLTSLLVGAAGAGAAHWCLGLLS